MKLPSFRKLLKQDFKEEFQELVEKIGTSVNNGFDLVSEALNKKITLQDNIACTTKSFDLEVSDTTGKLKTQVVFNLDTTGSILGITVLSAVANEQNVYPNAGVYLNFTQSANKLTITHAFGLPVGKKFNLKVVAFV